MSSLDASVYLLVIAYPLLFVVMAVFISRRLKKRDFLPAAVCGEGEKVLYCTYVKIILF